MGKSSFLGKRINNFDVLEYENQYFTVKCCLCGKIQKKRADIVKNGVAKCSCSKQREEHGSAKSRLYRTWSNMKNRCYNKNVKSYKTYGQNNVTVCDSWKNSFSSFRDWALSNGYNDDLEIDRIDVKGNYEPSNCRWIGREDQANNKSTNRFVEFEGRRMTLAQWARELDVPASTLQNRLNNKNFSTEQSLTLPVGTKIKKNVKRVLQFDKQNQFINEFSSIFSAATNVNIHPTGITKCCQGKQKTAGGFIWKYK